jgi:hypothetical protein
MPETETTETPEHITSPELREQDYDTAPDVVDTSEAESLDQVHATAAYNRAVMGPAANDPTVPTPGTDIDVEPGPGPEDNIELDNATGNAMSAAAESGTAWPEPPTAENYANRGELQKEADENLGIITDGEEGEEGEEDEGEFDPGDHTVAEVQDYIADHPEDEERVLEAERNGKNRAGLVG